MLIASATETVVVSDILSLTDAWGSEDSLGKVEGKLTAGQVISIDPLYEVIFEDADNTMDQRFGLSNPNVGLSGGAQFGKYQLRAARERADRLAEILTPVKLTQDHNIMFGYALTPHNHASEMKISQILILKVLCWELLIE